MSDAHDDAHDDGHDWLSDDYVDRWVHDWSTRPERSSHLLQVAAALPLRRDEPISILDVGGGWGPLSDAVLTHFPCARVTLVDYSPRMLEHAATHLAPHADRVELVSRDLTSVDWAAGLPAPFNAVVSSLAIHNLDDPVLITRVYHDVLGMLRPGGCFLDLDVVFPVGPALLAVTDRMQAFSRGADPDQDGPPPDAGAGDEWGPWDDAERRCSLANQLAWLRAAGFRQVDCLWRSGHVALLCGLAA